MRKLRMIPLSLLALLAAGCGGDDGTSGPAVPLASPADALRELGNFATIADIYSSGLVRAAQATGVQLGAQQARSRTAAGINLLRPGTPEPLPRQAVAQPRAVSDCTPAGTLSGTQSKTRSFTYFNVNETVSYATASYAAPCVSSSDDGTTTDTITVSGATETGATAADANGNRYVYAVFGAQNTPFTAKEVETDDTSQQQTQSQVLSLLGQLEAGITGDNDESIKLVVSGGLDTGSSAGTKSTQFSIGTSSQPLEIDIGLNTEGGGSINLSGSYAFTNPAVVGCNGASVTYTTVAPLLLANGSMFQGGTLKASSGANSATFVFASDGSAKVTFADGSQTALTAAQVSSAFSFDSQILQTTGC